jgi:hypothetical protein
MTATTFLAYNLQATQVKRDPPVQNEDMRRRDSENTAVPFFELVPEMRPREDNPWPKLTSK